MHWMGWLLYCVVCVWLAPATLWRPVALALLLTWGAAEVAYLSGGHFEPLWLYVPGDLIVIATILHARSHWTDWLILAPYPLIWWLYTEPQSPAQWAALYWIALMQFILAGPWVQAFRALCLFSHGPLPKALP